MKLAIAKSVQTKIEKNRLSRWHPKPGAGRKWSAAFTSSLEQNWQCCASICFRFVETSIVLSPARSSPRCRHGCLIVPGQLKQAKCANVSCWRGKEIQWSCAPMGRGPMPLPPCCQDLVHATPCAVVLIVGGRGKPHAMLALAPLLASPVLFSCIFVVCCGLSIPN